MAKTPKKATKVKIKKLDPKKGDDVKGGAMRRLR